MPKPRAEVKEAHPSGQLHKRAGHTWVRVSLPDRSRPRVSLCADECRCHLPERRLKEIAAAVSERERERWTREQAEQAVAAEKAIRTVRQLAEAWTSGKLLEEHGKANKLKAKRSSYDDSRRFALACEVVIDGRPFGDLAVADVTDQHAERLMAKLPIEARKRAVERERKRAERLGTEPRPVRDWRPATELQFYAALHRLFELAAMPCRLRPRGSNPFVKELRPTVKVGDKLFQWLYPDELLALLRCEAIPVGRRVLYAVATYTGQRKSSLLALRWRHVDFAHGTLTSPKQKNELPLTFAMGDDLAALLARWRELRGNPASTEALFPLGSPGRDAKGQIVAGVLGCKAHRLVDVLREDIVRAGIDRPALLGGEAHEEPLRFHDLRATMVVWGLKDPTRGYGWITDRTGHLSPDMVKRYDRAARSWVEARIVPFPPLVTGDEAAIPELAGGARGRLRAV